MFSYVFFSNHNELMTLVHMWLLTEAVFSNAVGQSFVNVFLLTQFYIRTTT